MRSLLILLFFVSCANCYKILGVYPCPSRSHYYVGHALMQGLAEEGHEVTMVSPFAPKKPIKNYKAIVLERSWEEYQKVFIKDNALVEINNLHFWDMTFFLIERATDMLNWTYASPSFQKLVQSEEQYDVVIIELIQNEALLGLGHHFKAPVIATSAFGAYKWNTDLVGTPNFASYVPFTTNGYTDRMDFWQRMYNSMSYWFEDIVLPLYTVAGQQKFLDEIFPNVTNMPTVEELKRNVALVLLNTHVTLGTPRPYAPNMIEVGGMQIKQKTDHLAPHIQKFLDEAKHGAIYLSFGSNLKFSNLPTEQKAGIINAFRDQSNIRLLIKTEENLVFPSHKTDDVLIEPWFAQESVLAHPNIRVFITHGGLLSTTESVHFGKAVIGVPFFFDQALNMRVAEQKGYGISVPYEELTEEKLRSAINKIISDPSYAENAKIISDRFRDQLKTPLETAIHWVKHVAKNKGAPHLRMVAVDLPFYALYNLDVWGFIVAVILITLLILRKIATTACKLVSSNRKIKAKSA